jgi:hypothetical protein
MGNLGSSSACWDKHSADMTVREWLGQQPVCAWLPSSSDGDQDNTGQWPRVSTDNRDRRQQPTAQLMERPRRYWSRTRTEGVLCHNLDNQL